MKMEWWPDEVVAEQHFLYEIRGRRTAQIAAAF